MVAKSKSPRRSGLGGKLIDAKRARARQLPILADGRRVNLSLEDRAYRVCHSTPVEAELLRYRRVPSPPKDGRWTRARFNAQVANG